MKLNLNEIKMYLKLNAFIYIVKRNEISKFLVFTIFEVANHLKRKRRKKIVSCFIISSVEIIIFFLFRLGLFIVIIN